MDAADRLGQRPPPAYQQEMDPPVTPTRVKEESDGLSCESICRIAAAVAVMFTGFAMLLVSPPGAFLLDALLVTVIGGPMLYMLLGENECTPEVAHCLCDLFSHMAVATVQSQLAPRQQNVYHVHQGGGYSGGYQAPRMPGNPGGLGGGFSQRSAPSMPGNPVHQW